MEPTDITVQILTDIRDQGRLTNERIDETNERLAANNRRLETTNARLDTTNERIDTMREELSRRIVDSEIRTSTAIADLSGAVHEMTRVLRVSHDLRPRVERCERDIDALRRNLGEAPER